MAEDSPSLPVLTKLEGGTPDIIDSPAELDDAQAQLSKSVEPVAIDTERAQGFRYGNEAWLVQVRREDAGTFLVDSHALSDLSELSAVLQGPWILHSGSQDLNSLAQLGMVPEKIFDTEIAARLVGIEQFSLRGTCEAMLGFTLEKNHQNENWSVRPLPKSWLHYAAMDVEVLPDLYRELSARLESLGRMGWAEQEFEYARTHPVVPRAPHWQNLKGVGKLRRPSELAIARELWEVRERIGREIDLAPGRLVNNRGLIEAAQRAPRNRRELNSIEPFRRPQARQYSQEWWDAIRRAKNLTPDEMPERADMLQEETPPPLRAWKKMRPTAVSRLGAVRELVEATASPLGLDPEVVLLPATQRLLAWDPLPRGDIVSEVADKLVEGNARPWQVELLTEQAAKNSKALLALQSTPIR